MLGCGTNPLFSVTAELIDRVKHARAILEKHVGRKGKHVALKDIYTGTGGEGNFVESIYIKSLNKFLGENVKIVLKRVFYLLLCFKRLTAILASLDSAVHTQCLSRLCSTHTVPL